MREFVYHIKRALVSGLRPNRHTSRNSPLLESCLNLLPYEGGLRPFTPIYEPVDEVKDFPYPQLLHGQKYSFVCGRTEVKQALPEGQAWLTSNITFYDSNNPNDIVYEVPEGGTWQMADARDFVMLTNGACVIYNDPNYNKFFISTDLVYNSVAYNNGRIIVGGFKGSELFKDAWDDLIFEEVRGRLSFLGNEIGPERSNYLLGSHKVDGSYLMWSSIGSVDFPLWLLQPNKANKEQLLSSLRRNEWGLVPAPTRADIVAIVPMGDRTIVYTNNGIYSMDPVTQGTFPSYKLSFISSVGIRGRNCVAGDTTHIFLTGNNKLAMLNNEGFRVLDYQEYVEKLSLINVSPTVTYDPNEEVYYIGGNYRSLCLTNTGIAEVKISPHSIVSTPEGSMGIVTDLQRNYSELVTVPFDLESRNIKAITNIAVSCADPAYITASVLYRFSRSEEFKESKGFELNKEGNCYPRISGVDFKVKLKSFNYGQQDVDSIQVKWQSSDKRATRGRAGVTDEGSGETPTVSG